MTPKDSKSCDCVWVYHTKENISRLIWSDLALSLSSIIPHNVSCHIYTPAILELLSVPLCMFLFSSGSTTSFHHVIFLANITKAIIFVFLFLEPSMKTAYSRGDDFLLVPFQNQKSIVVIIFLHDPSKLESLRLSPVDSLGPDSSLFWGSSLCIVRCSAALLASIQ